MVEVYLPFVDVLGTGKAVRRSVTTYMDQLVPMLVGGLTQFHDAQLAYFDPAHAVSDASIRREWVRERMLTARLMMDGVTGIQTGRRKLAQLRRCSGIVNLVSFPPLPPSHTVQR